jgi:hypothetical protein
VVQSRHLSDETGSLTTTKCQRQTHKFKKEAVLKLQKGILRRAVFYRNSSRNNRSLGADRQRVIHLGRSTPANQQREGYLFEVFLIDSADLPHCIFGSGFGCNPVLLDFAGTAIGTASDAACMRGTLGQTNYGTRAHMLPLIELVVILLEHSQRSRSDTNWWKVYIASKSACSMANFEPS